MILGRYNLIYRATTLGSAEVMYLTRVSDRQDVQAMAGELFHSYGSRKYLTQEERVRFLIASEQFPYEVQTFCHVITYTGCRPSEARALRANHIDLKAHTITFET